MPLLRDRCWAGSHLFSHGLGREVGFSRAGSQSRPISRNEKKDGWGWGCLGKGTGVWVGEHFVTGTILSPSPKGSAQLLFTTSTTKPREVEEPPRGHTGLLTPCPVLFPQCLQLWLHAGTLISAGAQVSLGEKAAAT